MTQQQLITKKYEVARELYRLSEEIKVSRNAKARADRIEALKGYAATLAEINKALGC